MPYDNASGHYILRFYDWAGPYLTLNLDSLISRPVHELMAAHCYNLVPQHEIHKFNNQPTIRWWIIENEQKPRFHEKVAKLCILIGDLQRRKHHPDTWSGILIFGGNLIFRPNKLILDLQLINLATLS